MLPFLTLLFILFIVACILEWDALAAITGMGLGVVLIYALFVYFTQVMIGLGVVVGLAALVIAGPPIVKGSTKIITKNNGE